MTQRLKLYTLGGLQVELDGVPLGEKLARKAEALLVYLALIQRPQYREQLAEYFWSNQSPANALGSLRVVLTQLRRDLEPFLDINRQTVGLSDSPDLWLDAHQLMDAVSQAERKLKQVDFLDPADADTLAAALTLYRGDFLAGLNIPNTDMFETWMIQQRSLLHRRASEGMQYLINSYDKHALFSQGIAWATKFVQMDNLSEEAHRLLMLLLARSGDRNAAIEQYADLRQILRDELDVEPEDDTTALYERIRAGYLNRQTRSSQTYNFAPQTTPFIGRAEELGQLNTLLTDPNCRLITITGVGGTGKTRLAIKAAETQVDAFQHGVYFVPLASLEDNALLSVTIVDMLQLPTAGRNNAAVQLFDYLRDKHALLVLDNFEHLIECSELLSELIMAAPGVKLLVTSREPLSLAEEWLLRLDGMPYPALGSTIELAEYPAAQLFLQNARRVSPNFQLSSDPTAIARICQLVEGLPLAIELAATWLRVVPPGEVATQIEHNLDFLTSSARNAPERHRSMRAVFEQAWKPLSEQEQGLLMRLSVFRGGFTLKSAQAVANATLPLIVGLLEKSLLRNTLSERYEMHELLRQFASEKLQDSGELEQTRGQHLAYYADYVEQAYQHLNSSRRVAGLRSFLDDIDNIRLALDWSERADSAPEFQFRLTGAMYSFWQVRGDFLEAHERLEAAVRRADAERTMAYARALYSAAGVAWWMGNYANALDYINRSIGIALELENTRFVGNSLRNRGMVFVSRGEHLAARADFERALSILQPFGDDWGITLALAGIAHTTLVLSDNGGSLSTDQVAKIEQDLIETWQGHALPLGNLQSVANNTLHGEQTYVFNANRTNSTIEWDEGKLVMARAFYKLGKVALSKHNFERAEAYLKDALMIFYECGHQQDVADVLDHFSHFAQLIEHFEKATMLLAAAVRLREVSGGSSYTAVGHNSIDERRALFTRYLGQEFFETLWLIGRQMSFREIISEVLQSLWAAP
ncbi:MAG: tetratricopeptide repeat protein [Burkholderiales bacterium]|nr:tetratricopeptide repeat protein [Anaerolineae bacterium]